MPYSKEVKLAYQLGGCCHINHPVHSNMKAGTSILAFSVLEDAEQYSASYVHWLNGSAGLHKTHKTCSKFKNKSCYITSA
eukprot:1139092-Pelagomonas_calceolata.AAC.2